MMMLFLTFCKIGILGFGGGMAIIALMYDNIAGFIDITQSRFADIVAIAQVTPGPVAVNTATYVGYEYAGVPGALIATAGVICLPFILVIIVCRLVTKFRSSPVVNGSLEGIRPATAGLVATALLTISAPAVFPEANRLGADIAKLSAEAGDFWSKVTDVLASAPFDIIAVLIAAATVVLIGKYKKNPFVVLIVMGCIGALLGV